MLLLDRGRCDGSVFMCVTFWEQITAVMYKEPSAGASFFVVVVDSY